QPAASATAKTFVAVASFFGGIAAAWAVLATLGIPLTLTEIVLFGCGSLLWRGAVSCMLQVLRFANSNDSRRLFVVPGTV
ncbi:MAG: hypothetical protein KGI83_06320, partial [Verrucomicrobiota bacterium]|nr:hypothetical protein [Verrucomicrobiota bacterium]